MKYKYNGQWLTIPTGGGSGLPDPSAADKMLISNDSLEWEEIDKEDVGTPTWTGTQAEYDAAKSDIADGTIVNITDDDGNMVGARTTEIYSTDELEIGRWINGKPLYRKVFNVTISNTKEQLFPHNISNVGMIMAKEWYLHNGTIWQNQAYAYPYAAGFTADATNVRIEKNSTSTWAGAESIMIIEYTKTTD